MTAQDTQMPEDIIQAANRCCLQTGADINASGEFTPIRDLIAKAIFAERHRDQWQPIETAPHSDQDILLYAYFDHLGKGVQDVGHWSEAFRFWAWSYCSPPTHWMPLPSDPKGGEA